MMGGAGRTHRHRSHTEVGHSHEGTMAPPTVIHIPHSSATIPQAERPALVLVDSDLHRELLVMTDWYTDILFSLPIGTASTLRYPVSRLVVDPERFVDDAREPMAEKGMGVIYTRTSAGTPLRKVPTEEERGRLISTYYEPHHRMLTDMTSRSLSANGRCLIIDGHSFRSSPLSHEPDQSPNRPQICIGTNEFHTPPRLVSFAHDCFRKSGFTVDVDRPFSGALVPLKHYRSSPRVH